MKIAIIGSMKFSKQMLETKSILEQSGHIVFLSKYAQPYSNLSSEDITKQTIADKNEENALTEFCPQIEESDAILVLNFDNNDIKNYIGGNTYLEMGYAAILGKKIFLLNPIPEPIKGIDFYQSEIEAMNPVILDGDITKIK